MLEIEKSMPPVPESTTFCSHRNQLSESLKVKKTLWFHFTHVFYKLENPNLYSRNIIYQIFNEQLEYWNTSMEYKNNLTCFSRTTFIQYTRCRLHAVTNQYFQPLSAAATAAVKMYTL